MGATIAELAGIPSAFNLNFLGFADKLVGNLFLIFGGLMISILVGYKALSKADAALRKADGVIKKTRAAKSNGKKPDPPSRTRRRK